MVHAWSSALGQRQAGLGARCNWSSLAVLFPLPWRGEQHKVHKGALFSRASSYEATELSKPSVRHSEHARLSPPTRHFPLTSISRHSNAMHTWQSEEMVALCYEMQNVERIPKNKFHRSSMELGYAGLEWTSLTWSWVHASPLFSDLVKKEYVGPAALSVFCFVCGAHI